MRSFSLAMDSGDSSETKDLIHSKFWKAKRGSQSSLQTFETSKRLTSPASQGSLTPDTLHQPIDHPFQSRSPRRALRSASPGTNPPTLSSTTGILASSILNNPHVPSVTSSTTFHSEVFRFDSADRERYLCSAISEEEEVFTPGPSPASSCRSYDSAIVVLDSPSITISSLHLTNTKDSPPQSTSLGPEPMESQTHLTTRVHTGIAMLPTTTIEQAHNLFGIPSSPISPLTPNTPLSPSPLFSDQMFQQGFLAELYRRRCHSDSDLSLTQETCKSEPTDLSLKKGHSSKLQGRPRRAIPHPLKIPTKGGSLESDHSSPQDSPLDLSMKAGAEGSSESLSSRFLSSLAIPPSSAGYSPVAVIRGDIASSSTRNSVALRYNLDVSPVVEQMPPGADMAFVCPMCGQMFSLHDRLAKHMASRHKSKPHDPNKSYPCDICHRSFARSDMLTRHMRLHTGVKPYTCRVCGQVFSRSDHLSTHQRTHTGEKPYKCPQCPYSACRRDMITRHLRTHTRNSSSSSSELQTPTSSSFSSTSADSLPLSDMLDRPIKMEVFPVNPIYSRPPSSSSSLAPDSPSSGFSQALNLSSLSVNSPSSPSQSQKE